MRAYQSNSFASGTRTQRPAARRSGVPAQPIYTTIYDVTLGWILRKIWSGLGKLAVAVKYQMYKFTAGFFVGWRLSWFKLALAVVTVFIVLKKDIQFSINMKAPAANAGISGESLPHPTRASNRQPQELSVTSAVSSLMNETGKTVAVNDLDGQRVRAYIHRFTKVAQAEMQKFGIPASVKMAQGILESEAGDSPNARQGNNHFGAPLAGAAYASAWENWRAHSLLLRGQYPQLFELGNNYKKWAKALREHGYNSDKHYDKKLIEVIEHYQLHLLD